MKIPSAPPVGLRKAYTLITGIGKQINADKRAGRTPKDYNLCKVSIPGTNLFCGSSFPIPRDQMPQFSGTPRPGSEAEKFPRPQAGKQVGDDVDGTKAYIKQLEADGIKVERKQVKATELKASQMELRGDKVNGMVANKDFDPAGEPIFISKDGYVIDGHHRWAAQVVRDIRDGKSGDLPLNVIVVDMPIKKVLKHAKQWADRVGIEPKAAKGKNG